MNGRGPQVGLRAAAIIGVVVATAWATPHRAVAQPDPGQLVEGVVAVVGDTAILWTELQQFLFERQAELQAQGIELPQDRESLLRFVEEALDFRISEVVLYIHARRAGILVSDREVNETVDAQLAQIRRRYPSDADFQQALLASRGITSAEFRIWLTERARVQLTTQQFIRREYSSRQPIPVSEAEIVQAFEAQRPTLGPRPATVSLKQVLIAPKPSEAVELAAREKAEQALSRLRAGEDFALVAREASEDVASRENGGDLGWVRQGQLLPEFEEVLFWMRPGQVSGIVETSVGYHIIKLERVRGAERLARHILVRLEVTDEDTEVARELAEEVAAALRGGADIDSLISAHGDPSEQSTLTNYPQDQLPPVYQNAIAGTAAGDVVGPIFMASGAGDGGKWVVARISELRPAGEWTLDDVRETLRMDIQQNKMIVKIISDLRAATHIQTRLDEFPLPGRP